MMKMIDHSNYEIYLIDLLDGKLNVAKRKELMSFLAANPHLKEEFEGLENTILIPTEIKFNAKQELKKSEIIDENYIQNILIAEIENGLNISEAESLKTLLKTNPEIEKERALFRKTILVPDESIVFENKDGLKKNKNKIRPLYYYISAAAAILVLVFIKGFFNPEEQIPVAYTARKNNFNHSQTETIKEISPNGTGIVFSSDSIKISKKNPDKANIKNEISSTPEFAVNKENLNDHAVTDSLKYVNIALETTEKSDSISDNKNTISHTITSAQLPVKKVYTTLPNGNEIITPGNCVPEIKNKKIDLANVFIKLTNKLINKKIKIKREYNCDGEVIKYAFASESFEYSKHK